MDFRWRCAFARSDFKDSFTNQRTRVVSLCQAGRADAGIRSTSGPPVAVRARGARGGGDLVHGAPDQVLKRIPDPFNSGRSSAPFNQHGVKATRQVVSLQVLERRAAHQRGFSGGDVLAGAAVRVAGALFDLHKHSGLAIQRDQVYLAAAHAVIALEDA